MWFISKDGGEGMGVVADGEDAGKMGKEDGAGVA